MIWRFGTHELDLSARGLIVGIVNTTPDSFSDGGRHADPVEAVAHGLRLGQEGADILDVGGESTRPGADHVDEAEELRRVVPVIRRLRARSRLPISVDTSKSAVAEAALAAGADIVNDVTSLRDPMMGRVVAAARAGLILMHMRGEPRTMQLDPAYPEDDVVGEVAKFLSERREAALGFGVDAASIILDPGLGFGKTLEHNLALIRGIPRLALLGAPLMIGHSRKSFLGKITGISDPSARLASGTALTALARESGARLFRVHEAAPHREALRVTEAILAA